MADELRAATVELTLASRADPAQSATVPAVLLPGVTTTLIVPPALLARLGLAERARKRSVTPAGVAEVAVHAAATAAGAAPSSRWPGPRAGRCWSGRWCWTDWGGW